MSGARVRGRRVSATARRGPVPEDRAGSGGGRRRRRCGGGIWREGLGNGARGGRNARIQSRLALARARFAFNFFPKLIVQKVGEVEGRRGVRSRKEKLAELAPQVSAGLIAALGRRQGHPQEGENLGLQRRRPARGRAFHERERIRRRRVPREELEQQCADGVHVEFRPTVPLRRSSGRCRSDPFASRGRAIAGRTPVASPNPASRISPSSEIATKSGHTSPWSVRSRRSWCCRRGRGRSPPFRRSGARARSGHGGREPGT